jgi:ubiquinone biosynthesis protein Coq4
LYRWGGEIMKVKKLGNYIELDGKLYQFASVSQLKDKEEMILNPISKPKLLLKKIDEVSNILADKLNKKELMRTALLDMPVDSFNKVYASLKKKKKVRQRHGCFEMVVGKEIIPIR